MFDHHRNAARVQKNVPFRFVLICRSHISSLVRTSGALSAIPALLTRISNMAKSFSDRHKRMFDTLFN